MEELPNYWLRRPESTVTSEQARRFRKLLDDSASGVPGIAVPVGLQAWQFLDWLFREQDVLFHGSPDGSIEEFAPRTPNDHSADDFSKQTAVYATSDSLWSIYYAVLDRSHGLRHLNAALQFQTADGAWTPLRYFFSIDRHAKEKGPWRSGFVYVLPRSGFVQQPPYRVQSWTVLDPHWANSGSVKPIARVPVLPADFPFLRHVRTHDDEQIIRDQTKDPLGFPWL